MKKLLAFLIVLTLFNKDFSQNNTFPVSGNVGIGTMNPITKLEIDGTYNTGIPSKVNASAYFTNSGIGLYIGSSGYSYSYIQSEQTDNTYLKHLVFQPNGGNVGIGTTNPQAKLDINGNTYANGFFTNGNNGIDPNNPYSADIVIGSDLGTRHNGSIMFWSTGSASRIACPNDVFQFSTWFTTTPNAAIASQVGASSYFQGNVLIGKTSQINPTYKLDVAGNARINKVVVNTTGADFVFDSSYQLQPLSEVAKYIQQNKHLPNIEPARQMQQNGLDLGDNQTKLLQKIEELTLYLIEQNKKTDQLIIENGQLKKENKEIRKEIEQLKAKK